VICAALALAAGFIGYFLSWPYGAEIAPLAAPAGIAVWAFKSGDMASLLRVNTALTLDDTIAKRQAVYAILKWECLFWLALVACGYLGVRLAAKLFKAERPAPEKQIPNSNTSNALAIVTALIATVVIAQFAMTIFAQDVRKFDSELGTVIGQPGSGQIAFALILSFAAAAFVAKHFLDVNYIYPAIAACGLGFYGVWIATKPDVLQHMIQSWPEAFFSRSTSAVLPVQMIAFASIGAVVGYWGAVKYAYWRKHGD
jgi:hypothetical protein